MKSVHFSTRMAPTSLLPSYSPPSCLAMAKSKPPPQKSSRRKPAQTKTPGFGGEKKDPVWQCVQNCGACCKLDKGPNFLSPAEIFEEPADVELCKSMIGEDGWCIHYDKSTRKCSIYDDRPYFCRVEPEVFHTLYGIDKKKFNKEACSCCIDSIKAVYGTQSKELERFNQAIWRTPLK